MSELINNRVPPEKLVRVTFLPEGTTLEFRIRYDAVRPSRQVHVVP
jgi:hypothetical protein